MIKFSSSIYFSLLSIIHPVVGLILSLYIFVQLDSTIIGTVALNAALFSFTNDIVNVRYDIRATQLGLEVNKRVLIEEYIIKLIIFISVFFLMLKVEYLGKTFSWQVYIWFILMIPASVNMKYFFYVAHKLSKKSLINYEIALRIIFYCSLASFVFFDVVRNEILYFLVIIQTLPYFLSAVITSKFVFANLSSSDDRETKNNKSTNKRLFFWKNIFRNILSTALKQFDILIFGSNVPLDDLSIYKILKSVFIAIDSLSFSLVRYNAVFGMIVFQKYLKLRVIQILSLLTFASTLLMLFNFSLNLPTNFSINGLDMQLFVALLIIVFTTMVNALLNVYSVKQFATGDSGLLIKPQLLGIILSLFVGFMLDDLNAVIAFLLTSYFIPKFYILSMER